jgi:hypothetical protein
MKNKLFVLILAIFIISCQQRQADKTSYPNAYMEEEFIPDTQQSLDEQPSSIDKLEKQEVNKKKIIKDGRLGLRVTELQKTKDRVDSLVIKQGGYYSNESFNNSDWESSFNLKIRIPSTNFENFISDLESGDGEILYKVIDARDVTDQFIDLETRLENKRNYLKRYKDLLQQAKTIKEILEIEEKIRGLEEEIESTTGRLKYLSDQVDYSTLDLTISKKKDFRYNPTERDKFSERLKQSLSKGWFGFVDFILFFIWIWPFWVVIVLILIFLKKYKKTKKAN